jgi:hypothetical protein
VATPRTGTALAVLAWAATVLVATLVGMSAVGAIGSGILGAGQEPLTAAEVDQALASARSAVPPTASAQTPAPVPTDPAGMTEVIPSPGGTVVARCMDGAVEVVSASPAQGYRLDEQEYARVQFESEETDVDVELRCRDGRPVGVVEVDE